MMTTAVVRTVLNYKNYDHWSSQIKTYLLAEDLWDVLSQERPKTEDEESKAWERKDAKALYAIQNSCGDDTYKLIKDKTTAKEAWNSLFYELKQMEEMKQMERALKNAYKSVGKVYPTPGVSMEEGRTGEHDESDENLESIHRTFAKHVKSNALDNAIKFLQQHPQLGCARLPFVRSGTALHYAIQNLERFRERIIQQLVELMAMEDLEIQDNLGYTALDYLIKYYPERVEVAECMVKRNQNLLNILPPHDDVPRVVVAQKKTKGGRMARWLYSLTSPETLNVIYAAQLISDGFRLQRFDIAWNLIQRYPKLAIDMNLEGNIPLGTLASNPTAFKSGSRLNLWEKMIYHGISINLPDINTDIRINVGESESEQSDQRPHAEQKENKRHLIYSGINRIYKMKLVHEWVQQFLPLMCKAASQEDMSDYQRRKLDESLCMAAERGHVEYITHLLRYSSYPIFKVRNEKRQSLFQIAAECRHYNVYNTIYELLRKLDKSGFYESKYGLNYSEQELKEMVEHKDDLGNTMLHTAARITPLSQIDDTQGATLQMQRELQWFKKVESIADVKDRESVNNDNKTPREVFTENHKEMWKEAKNSMKETANSCTVVGALIITIMFAAVFTVPGGYDGGTGLPMFLTKKVFIAFMVSDALSLFSSITSVIMFLSVITSHYNEDNFCGSLPTKMIIGLLTLFLSIVTMMIVFFCALYIMLDGKSSIVIPTNLLASVPLTSFLWMQFPLLVESFLLFDWEHLNSKFLHFFKKFVKRS